MTIEQTRQELECLLDETDAQIDRIMNTLDELTEKRTKLLAQWVKAKESGH